MKFGRAASIVWALCLAGDGRTTTTSAQEELTAESFKAMIDAGSFAAVLDVRTSAEFYGEGHVANATLVESLASYGTSDQISTPSDLAGCEHCDLAVYCRSGRRADEAIRHLLNAGFVGRLYNGLGVSQWTAAGYPLVTGGESTPAPCAESDEGAERCRIYHGARTKAPRGAVATTAEPAPTVVALATTPGTASVMTPAPTTTTSGYSGGGSNTGLFTGSGVPLFGAAVLAALLSYR